MLGRPLLCFKHLSFRSSLQQGAYIEPCIIWLNAPKARDEAFVCLDCLRLLLFSPWRSQTFKVHDRSKLFSEIARILLAPADPSPNATATVAEICPADTAADPSPDATAAEVVNEALPKPSAKRQRDMNFDAFDGVDGSRTPAPVPPSPPTPTQAELLSALTKEAIDEMDLFQLKRAASNLGLRSIGLVPQLKQRLKNHLVVRHAASGGSNPSLASTSSQPAPSRTTTSVTVNAHVAAEAGAAPTTLEHAPVLFESHANNAIADVDAVLENPPTPMNAAAAAIAGTRCMVLFEFHRFFAGALVSSRPDAITGTRFVLYPSTLQLLFSNCKSTTLLRRYRVAYDNGDSDDDDVRLEELFHPPATHARPTAHVTPVSEHRQPELGVLLHAALAIGVIDAEAPAEAPAVPAAKKSCLRWDPVDPVEQRAKRQRAKRPRSNVRFCGTVSDNDGKTTPLMEEFDWPRKVRRTGIGDGSTTVGDGSGTGVGDGIGTGVGDGTSTVVGDVSGTAVGDGIGTNDNAGAVGALVGAANGDWIGTGIGDGSTTVGDGSGAGVGDGIGTGVGDGSSTVVGDVSDTAVGDGIGTNDNAGAVGALVGAANSDWIGTGICDGSTTVGDGSGTGVADGIGTGVGDGSSTVVGDVSVTAVGDGIGTDVGAARCRPWDRSVVAGGEAAALRRRRLRRLARRTAAVTQFTSGETLFLPSTIHQPAPYFLFFDTIPHRIAFNFPCRLVRSCVVTGTQLFSPGRSSASLHIPIFVRPRVHHDPAVAKVGGDDEIDVIGGEPDPSDDTMMSISRKRQKKRPPPRARSVDSLPVPVLMGHSSLEITDARELFTFPMEEGARSTVKVTVGDRVRCQDGVWFNDNVIALYRKWLLQESPPPLEPQHHFSTHFYTKLTQGGRGMNHGNVQRWTLHVPLFRKSLVTIPIEHNKHWTLIIVANLDMIVGGEFEPGIYVIDPLGLHQPTFVTNIREYLEAEWNANDFTNWRACPIDLANLPVHYPQATLQNNGDDCGVYTGVVYLTKAISVGRLKPASSFFMSKEDAAEVRFKKPRRHGMLSTRHGIVRIRREIYDLMTKLATEFHSAGHVYRNTVKVYAKEAEADGVLETVAHQLAAAVAYTSCFFRGGRFPMPRSASHASYAHVDPEPSEDSNLADEGFLQYLTKGTEILALPISETDIEMYFPGGKVDGNILSGSGSSSIVLAAGDVLAMPFPEGGQVYPIKKTLFEKTYTIQDRATSHAEREAYVNRTSLVRTMEKHATAVRNTLKSLGLNDATSAISTAVPAGNDGEVGAEPSICLGASPDPSRTAPVVPATDSRHGEGIIYAAPATAPRNATAAQTVPQHTDSADEEDDEHDDFPLDFFAAKVELLRLKVPFLVCCFIAPHSPP